MKRTQPRQIQFAERISSAIGSVPSLILHTLVFIGCFVSVYLGYIALETMLLILTTIVSLEAIYLAILIQMGVNENTKSLRVVEEDLDEIQEDVEELGEDLEEIQEDIEEISEDVGEIQEDIDELQEDVEEMSEEDKEEDRREQQQAVNLEQLTDNVRRILEDLEALKKGK